MTIRDRFRLKMLFRVRDFGAGHARLFPDTSAAHDAFAVVAAEIDRLQALDVIERTATDGSRVGRKTAARQALVNTLMRAAATARVLVRTHPNLEAAIEGPLPANSQALLAVARAFAARAVVCAAGFAAHGMPLTTLQQRIDAFECAITERSGSGSNRVMARAEIQSSFTRAMEAVEALDVNVANYLEADPVAQAVWAHARRLGYAPRTRRAAAVVVQPTSDVVAQPATDAVATEPVSIVRLVPRATRDQDAAPRHETLQIVSVSVLIVRAPLSTFHIDEPIPLLPQPEPVAVGRRRDLLQVGERCRADVIEACFEAEASG